jgi:hypothetical protein
MIHRTTRLYSTSTALGLALISALSTRAVAQGGGSMSGNDYPIDRDVRAAHTVSVSPHRLILTPDKRTATLEFTNGGDKPAEADVEIQFAYPRWQNSDTVLFSPAWRDRRVRDTVIADPPPGAPFAGPWISGIPTHLSLGPREKRTVTLRINPPAGIADGEYWARITTIVRKNKPDKPPKSKDAKAAFKMPIIGQRPPDLRDSVEVYYRKGTMSTGVKVLLASARVDSLNRPTPEPRFGSHQLWMLFHVRPTGTAHFEGQMRVHAHNETTGRNYPYNPAYMFSLYNEGVMRFFATTSFLEPGKYRMIVHFEQAQGDANPDVPVTPTEVSMPFEVNR